MGYTHYWRRRYKEEPIEKWRCFIKDVEKAYEYINEKYHIGGKLSVNDHEVFYEPEEPGETLYIARRVPKPLIPELWCFNFCKTNRYSYDTFVCVVLLLAAYHFDDFEVSTDGDYLDWEDAIEIFAELFPSYKCRIDVKKYKVIVEKVS